MHGRPRFDVMKRVPLWLVTCSSQPGQTEMNSNISKPKFQLAEDLLRHWSKR